ncbi:MAG: hypothetical protein ACXVP4_07910 [Bacteroidia bacterium]
MSHVEIRRIIMTQDIVPAKGISLISFLDIRLYIITPAREKIIAEI